MITHEIYHNLLFINTKGNRMQADIKLVAIDLDDTLLRDDISISDYTKEVLQKVKAQGVRIVIATGRMFKAARPWGMVLNLGDVPMVVYTGSMTARCESGTILNEHLMNLNTARQILQTGREHGWYMQSYIDDELYVPYRDDRTDSYEKNCGVTAHVLGDAFWTPEKAPLKVLVYENDPAVMEEVSRVMIEKYGDRAGYVCSSRYFFELNSKQASKGEALTELCAQWDIPLQNIAVFGNAQNDVSMLKLTPWSFAVANAAESARQAARFITASNNEDGVAKALEKYILK